MQNCVRSLLEKIQKSVRNVLVFKIVSENCQFVIQKSVRNMSEQWLLFPPSSNNLGFPIFTVITAITSKICLLVIASKIFCY